ncbi:MAG TPA: hypothetical protein VIL30_25035 [Ramlibacter sp.]|jgi:hypothetical protein
MSASVRAAGLRGAVVLVACWLPVFAGAQHALTAAEYIRGIAPVPGVTPVVLQESLQTPQGELLVGMLLPRVGGATPEPQAILFVARLRADGIVQESVKTAPFAFYSAGGRHYVEQIRITSPSPLEGFDPADPRFGAR